jgi:hypothetical protein
LLLGQKVDGLAQIAVFGSQFVTFRRRRLPHARFQFVGQFFIFALQQQAHVAHRFLVLVRLA